MPRRWKPSYDEDELRAVIAASVNWSEALRRLGLRPAGHNHRTIQRHVAHWKIPTDHFDPNACRRAAAETRRVALTDLLVENSTYSRGSLKRRLYDEGFKERRCELCGQDEDWHGARMSLILDHVNGDATDNRLANLQIVCPNRAATLDTHCGRNKQRLEPRACAGCNQVFQPRGRTQRYCSHRCAGLAHADHSPRPESRKVDRPPYDVLLAELAASSYLAVGRKYGVSDNAVRKWVRWYERERTDEAA